jgi:Flp pilus assembly protein TadD
MGHRMRGAAAILSLGLAGLAGCHVPNLGYSSAQNAGSGTSANFMPSMSPPLDGAGPGQSLELPKQKKVDALLATARLMEKSGRSAEAIGYYEQVRMLDPRLGLESSRHLAILYDRKNEFDKALDEYAILIKANPKDATAHSDRGYSYYARGQFEAAEKDLRKAVELDPRNKQAWTNLGMTLAQLGRYQESQAAFEKVVNRPQAMCNVGMFQVAQGKWNEAKDSFAMALELEPGLQKARAAMERLQEGRAKERERAETKRRMREMERLGGPGAGQLPFDVPTGAIGADMGMIDRMIYISPEVPLMNLPMPGAAPPVRPTAVAADLPGQLPPIPSTLVVD